MPVAAMRWNGDEPSLPIWLMTWCANMSHECEREAPDSVELSVSGATPAAARCWFSSESRYCSPAVSIEQPLDGGGGGCGAGDG